MNRYGLNILFLLFFCLPVHAGTVSVDIKEWKVPWEKTRPRDPYVAPDGSIWFCGQGGGYLARFDPATEKFRKFELGKGAGPHNLIIDKAGFVWYAGNLRGHIGRLDPDTGEIRKYPMPNENVTDPHTLVFDRNGDIWFTAQISNYIGRLSVATGEIRLVPVPMPHARPYGIRIDSRAGHGWRCSAATSLPASIR